jgi:hypothetical protein
MNEMFIMSSIIVLILSPTVYGVTHFKKARAR